MRKTTDGVALRGGEVAETLHQLAHDAGDHAHGLEGDGGVADEERVLLDGGLDVEEAERAEREEHEVVHDVDAVFREGNVLLEVDLVGKEHGGGHEEGDAGAKCLRQVVLVQQDLDHLQDEV